MNKFSRLKRISSLTLAIVLTLSMAMPYLGTVFASNTNENTIGWTELGVTQNTTYTTSGETREIGSASNNDFSNLEFEGIMRVASGGKVQFGFGGSSIKKAFKVQVNSAGKTYIYWNNSAIRYINSGEGTVILSQSLQDVDLLINIKMAFTAKDDTTSKGNFTLTLTDAASGTQLYTETFENREITTADLVAKAWVYTDTDASLSAKFPVAKTKIGWTELGVTENTIYTTSGATQEIGSASNNDFSNLEFEGIMRVASGGKVQFGFGGSSIKKAFKVQVNSAGKTYIYWNNSAIRYINSGEGTVILSQSLQDVDLLINIKMAFTSKDDTTSKGNFTLTLTDAATETQLYTETFTNREIATADLAAKAWVYTDTDASLTAKFPIDETTTISTIGWKELGMTGNTTYATSAQNQQIGSASPVDFSDIEFKGIIHATSGGRVRFGFGGSDIEKAFQMQVRSDGFTYLRWNNQVIRYINCGEASGPMLSQSLQDVDIIIHIQMSFTAIDATNSKGSMTVTLTDAATETELYSETFNNKEIATADLVANAWVYTDESATMTAKFSKIGWNELGVTEETVYTTAGEYKAIGNTSTEAVSSVEFEGLINITSGGKVKFGFGGRDATKGFQMQVNADGRTYLKWNDSAIRYINCPDVAGSPILSKSLQNIDLLFHIEMVFATTDSTNSSGNFTVTLTDAATGTQLYTETFENREIATADLVANAWAYTEDDGKLTAKLTTITEGEEENDPNWECAKTVTAIANENGGYDVTGSGYRTAHYLQKLQPQHTTLSFKLKSAGEGGKQTVVIAMTENKSMGMLPGPDEMKESKAMVLTLEQKTDKTVLSVVDKELKSQVLTVGTFKTFDYEATHTLTFKNEYGNWYLVFDGTVLRSTQLNKYMEPVLSAEEGVYYRFTGWQDYTFNNVQFLNTPTDATATSNWDVVGYEMSGEGDNLTFTGKGYASWKKPVDLTKTTIRMQFKTVKGGSVRLTVADIPMLGTNPLKGLMLPEAEENAITILFSQENDTDLYLRLFGILDNGKQNGRFIMRIKNFNFDVPHDVRFVEKNGNYYISLDGQILEWPKDDGANKYITAAITDCLSKVGKNAYLRFADEQQYGVTLKNIAFVEEPFVEADIFIDGAVTVEANKNGLSAVGKGTLGINKKFDITKDKIKVKFNPQVGNWIGLIIGDTASTMIDYYIGTGNDHNMMAILLERQEKDSQLNIYLYDKENGKERVRAFMRIKYFDFDATHSFSFVEHRGKYYLTIDERMIEAVQGDGEKEIITTWVTKCVKSLSKTGAYVRFVSPKSLDVSNISWESMGMVNGVQIIGTAADTPTIIKKRPEKFRPTPLPSKQETTEKETTKNEQKQTTSDEVSSIQEETTGKVNWMLILPIVGAVVLVSSIIFVVGWKKRFPKTKKK